MTISKDFQASRWPLAPVGALVELTNGFPFASSLFTSEPGVPLVRIRDVGASDFDTFVSGPVPETALLADGDVVIAMDGDFRVERWSRGPAALNQRLCRLRGLSNCDLRYVSYALPIALMEINETQHATTVKHLSSTEILRVRIPLPPLDEQRRIANYLDDQTTRIDLAIKLRQQQRDALAERSAAVWEDTARDLANEYGTAPLRRFLMSIADGPFGSALKSSHYTDSGVRVVRLGNIGLAEFRGADEAFIDPHYANELKEHEVVAGDIVMAGLGDERWPLGRATVVPDGIGPAIVKADCYRLRLRPVLRHDFAAWYLSSPVGGADLKQLGRGSTRQRLNTDVVKDVPVAVPPLAVQTEILRNWEARSRVDGATQQALERSVELLAERRRSVISQATGGRRPDPSHEVLR